MAKLWDTKWLEQFTPLYKTNRHCLTVTASEVYHISISPSKIFPKVIVNYLSLTGDGVLQRTCSFQKGRGCKERIYTLRNYIEQCHLNSRMDCTWILSIYRKLMEYSPDIWAYLSTLSEQLSNFSLLTCSVRFSEPSCPILISMSDI